MKWLVTALLLTNINAFAGDKGNGGDGIEIDGKLYVLDLFEAGVEKAPFFDQSIKPDQTTLAQIKFFLSDESYPHELIARKLEEIKTFAPVFSAAIFQTIINYQWRLVNGSLADVKDEDTVLENQKLVQLAVRKSASIHIDRSLWAGLNPENKAALVFHEVLYAMIKPRIIEGHFQQVSSRAREVTGYLFTKNYIYLDLFGLSRVLRKDYMDAATDWLANQMHVRYDMVDINFAPVLRVNSFNQKNEKEYNFQIKSKLELPENFLYEEICQDVASAQNPFLSIISRSSSITTSPNEFHGEGGPRVFMDFESEPENSDGVIKGENLKLPSDELSCITVVRNSIEAKLKKLHMAYETNLDSEND